LSRYAILVVRASTAPASVKLDVEPRDAKPADIFTFAPIGPTACEVRVALDKDGVRDLVKHLLAAVTL
jgi:hypothetical protein